MRYAVILVALVGSACGSSPIAPTPAASLTVSGNLTVTGCVLGASGSLYSCANYSGLAVNAGPGCASGVRGVTTTFDAATRTQVGSSAWTYAAPVRVGEQISYAGGALVISSPLVGGWLYTTTLTWDSVPCR